MFRDVVYENMDEISKLIEEYDDKLSDALSSIPEIVEVKEVKYTPYMGSTVSLNQIVYSAIAPKLMASETSLLDSDIDFLSHKSIFKIEKSSEATRCYVDESKNKIVFDKPIIIKKMVNRLSEQDILELCVIKWNLLTIDKDKALTKCLNELIYVLFPQDETSDRARKTKSKAKKINYLYRRIKKDLITKNMWNIRNTELICKMMVWIQGSAYGNLNAKANLAKLACMRHNGHAIYSIEEIA